MHPFRTAPSGRGFRRAVAGALLVSAIGVPAVLAGGLPDIVVSGIGSTLVLYGTLDIDPGPGTQFVSGYALPNTYCNIGESDAITMDCQSGPQCNQHPVIGQNVFRLRDGRFEQLGQAWLFHEYCAADQPGCGEPYGPNGSCDFLGPHGQTTHSPSLFAQQTNLGPKSEVQPWTGAFAYPFVRGWGQSGDALYKRVQIAANDLNPAVNSGALYFGESQMVCTDEPPQNRHNNVSYRRIVVGAPSGNGWNLAFSGDTVQQAPAIQAWQAYDPEVTLTPLDVPDDGRFISGARVTDLRDGHWRYEFAVYNMNSDRAAGAFSVPIAAGVSVTNVGFHSVPYHSEEPYSSAAWAAVLAGGRLTWASEPFEVNVDANALRWGTLYNFHFEADAAPAPGMLEVGLFRPGAPSALSFSGPAPAAADPCAAVARADADCDGSVDFFDIDPFLAALFDNPGYLANADWCGNNCAVDVNRDGGVDFFDIDPFVTCLFGVCP
jgi:hypothetical protein